jgi:ABC-2 type transport system permease protein
VIGAKAVVLTAMALVAGAAATAVAVAVGQLVLVGQGLPAVDLAADPRIFRLALAAWLLSPLCALLAVALAFIVRSTGGAMAAVFAVMSLTAVIDQLPEQWRAALLPYAPISALTSATGVAQPGDLAYLAPAWAGAVLLSWCAALFAIACIAFPGRDV